MRKEIRNRKGFKIVILLKEFENPKGTAIVMHGLGGFKEQLHIRAFAEAFENEKYTTITFDTTNSIGESGGKFEDATITNYYEDLEDVIAWAEKQAWFKKPLILSGHSLGGFSAAFYAENYPSKIYAIAPISPLISGELSVEAHKIYEPEEFNKWEKTGWLIKESSSKPGVIKKLPWSHMTDRLKYDLLKKADRLMMPVLLIVGEKDTSVPVEHVKILFKKIPSRQKSFYIIKNAPHTFKEKLQLEEIKKIFQFWLSGLNK